MASKLQVSGSVRGNFKCTWTIEGFSLLDAEVGVCHRSDVFQLEENGVEWYLSIYPGGQTEDNKDYVACFIYRKNMGQCMKWKYNISLRDSYGAILFNGMADKWVDLKLEGWGHVRTVRANDLASQLDTDVLVVVLEATYCATCVSNGIENDRHAEITPLQNLSDDWRNLWKSERNADCVISVSGEDIPAHSLVLSTRSEVFAAMFEHETLEKSSCRVDITDFDKDTMDSLIEFIYTGNVLQMSSDLALELLRAGDKYQVNNLKSYCTNYLMSVLNKDNACQVLASAYIHNADRMYSHAVEYIRENLSEEDLQAQHSMFQSRSDVLWSVFKQVLKKKKTV